MRCCSTAEHEHNDFWHSLIVHVITRRFVLLFNTSTAFDDFFSDAGRTTLHHQPSSFVPPSGASRHSARPPDAPTSTPRERATAAAAASLAPRVVREGLARSRGRRGCRRRRCGHGRGLQSATTRVIDVVDRGAQPHSGHHVAHSRHAVASAPLVRGHRIAHAHTGARHRARGRAGCSLDGKRRALHRVQQGAALRV